MPSPPTINTNSVYAPTAVIQEEQSKLKHDLQKTIDENTLIKSTLCSIVSAALANRQVDDNISSHSDDSNVTTASTVIENVIINKEVQNDPDVSLESIKAIYSEEEYSSDSENDDDVVDKNKVVPDIDEVLRLARSGKIHFSDEVLRKLNNLIIRVEANNKVNSELQDRLAIIDNLMKEQKKIIQGIQQYIKLDNLLLHRFPQPAHPMSSLQFSYYVADLLNYFLPNLPVPVSWQHISDAHPLKTKAKKSSVIIVRFCNRNIRHAIYDQRNLLKKGLAITEHLTENNLGILNRAKELFGFHNAYTEKSQVLIKIGDKIKKVHSVEDVNEEFEATIAQQLGSPELKKQNSSKHTQSHSITHNQTPAPSALISQNKYKYPYNSYHYNNAQHNDSYRYNNYQYNAYNYNYRTPYYQDQSGHRNYRERSKNSGYSVRNRHYPNH